MTHHPLNELIAQTLKLKPINERMAYYVAKEIALIELNIMWNKDNNKSRLKSLAVHVKDTFKKSVDADELVKLLIDRADSV